jgi:tetratricopeptide (TPR) repeat protein
MKMQSLLLCGALAFGAVLSQPAIAQTVFQVQTQDLTYDDYMSLGYNAYEEGRYYEATQYFRYALYLVPNDQAAITAYWNAYDLMGQDTSASNFDTLMNQGYDATDAGDYEVAITYFEQALAIRPGDPYASQALRNVQTYLNYGDGVVEDPVLTSDFSESGETLSLYTYESAYDRYMRLGYGALQVEDFQAAISYFRSALYERPNDRTATIAYWNAVDGSRDGEAGLGSETTESAYDRYMRLGYDATQRRNYEAAIQFFQEALVLRPDRERYDLHEPLVLDIQVSPGPLAWIRHSRFRACKRFLCGPGLTQNVAEP